LSACVVPTAVGQSPSAGTAVSLDGTSAYVSVPAGIWFSNDFTIEGWVYVRSYNNWSRLLDFGNAGYLQEVYLALSESTTGYPKMGVFINGNYNLVGSSQPLPTNQWTHLAATLSGTNATIFINGNPVGSGGVLVPGNFVRTNNYIGRSLFAGDAYANAIFDDIRLWNVARTQTQIQTSMNHNLLGNEPGLLGYWRLDEGVGTSAFDSTANGHTATLMSGATWTNSGALLTPPSDYALSFNNQCVIIPHLGAQNAYPLTVMCWFQAPTNTSGGALVNKYVSSSYNGYQIFLSGGHLLGWYFRDPANNVFSGGPLDAGPVNDGLWHHAAMVVDANGGRLYLDGLLRSSLPWSGAAGAVTTTAPLGLGIYQGDSVWVGGELDEVSLWNASLTAAQIKACAQRALRGTEPGLLAYYRLNEGIGTNIFDYTSNTNTGALSSPPPSWIISRGPAAPALRLWGANPLTNECHTAFVDPGALMFVSPASLAGGTFYSLALKADGTVLGWGDNSYGETNVPASATNVMAISAGGADSLALKADGTVLGWGQNLYGQTNVPASATNVVAIAAGDWHNLALRADGTVIGWGENEYGQTNVPALATNVVAIAAGQLHSLALKADGTVIGWGYNGDGEITIPASATNVVAIATADNAFHSLALKADGTVLGWGLNDFGQTTIPSSATNVVAIAANESYSLALKADGTILGWGENISGQTTIPSSATNVVAIAAGYHHVLALKADGTVLGWGYNGFGETTVPSSVNDSGLPVFASGIVQTNSPGAYTRTYSGTDLYGTLPVINRTVWVADSLPPTVSLNGPNPLFLLVNTPFAEPGFTASDLCAGDLSSNVVVTGTVNTSLAATYGLTYSVSDFSGNRAVTNRWVVVYTPPSVPGDLNGDGRVDQLDLAALLANLNGNGSVNQTELNLVLSNYWSSNPLYLADVVGLGGRNVTFALTNSTAGAFSVQYSTNLSDWYFLGPAIPRYLFTDTNAPAHPQRFYRLRWP
jgi:alpha-tubulin suppressor-like RCC1 family protein